MMAASPDRIWLHRIVQIVVFAPGDKGVHACGNVGVASLYRNELDSLRNPQPALPYTFCRHIREKGP